MLPAAHPVRRQLWNAPPTATTGIPHARCTPFTLPSFGVIAIDATQTITLAADATFTPECIVTVQNGETTVIGAPTHITDLRDPFNASVTPQVYATGAATVIAWMLVIMLIITPRTFFMGGPSGTSGLLGRRGLISGASGGASIIGVGSRPWLQKIASLTVAISLTIATAETFRVAERQYVNGYMDAGMLRMEVVGGLEIKISRIISDIFLWLAQVQTLIRLFSRHKEKVIIKWVGFGLIVLDMTFTILNNFLGSTNQAGRRHFVDAIPALNYLFQCALSMLYAAWVMYYALTKRRYAWYHKLMPNISVVAVLSIIAVLTPLVFFITDIANYNVAGWGDYFRWVGAAAASVVVWEWVERIEVLEREEKKDGILGREVFDGDEMLENTPHAEVNWPSDRQGRGNGRSGGTNGHHGHGLTNRFNRRSHLEPTFMVPLGRVHSRSTTVTEPPRAAVAGQPTEPIPPQPIASPVSRTDTTSATSTVYTVRYHTFNEPTTPLPRRTSPAQPPVGSLPQPRRSMPAFDEKLADLKEVDTENSTVDTEAQARAKGWQWPALPTRFNPFQKKRHDPPMEVQGGRVIDSLDFARDTPPIREKAQPQSYGKWDLKGRLGAFAAEQTEKIRERANAKTIDMILPVTIIPAQPRGGRTWSPDNLPQNPNSPTPYQTYGLAPIPSNATYRGTSPSLQQPSTFNLRGQPHDRRSTNISPFSPPMSAASHGSNSASGSGSAPRTPRSPPPGAQTPAPGTGTTQVDSIDQQSTIR